MFLSHHRRRTRPLFVCAGALLLLSACDSADDPAMSGEAGAGAGSSLPEPVYPGAKWAVGDPEEYGFDADKLEAMTEAAEELNSHCLVVTRHGKIVGEWYWDGWDKDTEQAVFSASKSITSTLVGIAQDEGALDIGDKASKYIEEWRGTDSEDVTIRNLIRNDSGRSWSYTQDYLMMALSSDMTGFSIGLSQQHSPGEHWEYNNSAIQTLDRVLSVATGMHPTEYARKRLFEPLGMQSEVSTDPSGNAIVFTEVSASCRDLARFGYLFLREGEWADGERIVSKKWVREATVPSTELNTGYGYMWWLNADGHYVLPSNPGRTERDGQRFEDVADNVYMALGLGGQVVSVDPNRGIVMTHIAGASTGVAAVLGSGGLGELSADSAAQTLSTLLEQAVVE